MSISTADATLWPAPQARGPIDAVVTLPGSKSQTNRLLVLAALSDEATLIRRPLRARDTELMASGLRQLGIEVDSDHDDWVVTPRTLTGPAQIDCGLAGNVMRFLPAIAGLATGRIDFDGDPAARLRPLAPLLNTLRALGVDLSSPHGDQLPVSVLANGHVVGGAADIDASASSQFVSALLLAGCRYDDGLQLRSVGAQLPSLPHINMTVTMLRQAGIAVTGDESSHWAVPRATPRIGDVAVEPDLSNALPFVAAGMITGGRCVIPGWPGHSIQPVDTVTAIVHALGGELTSSAGSLTVQPGSHLTGGDLDMSDVGELVPTVTAIAALASSPTLIRGVAHLRGHETNRLAALSSEFTALGGDVTETEDGLLINPCPLRPGVFHTYDDHRMATAGALVGLAVPGILVENVATTAKTLPAFTALWERMLGNSAT